MAVAIVNNSGLKVLTPSGFQPFSAINLIEQKQRLKITLENGIELQSSFNHPFKDKNDVFVLAKNFIVGEQIQTKDGLKKIISIESIHNVSRLYDLLDVGNGNEYYTNDVISHNCEFISSDPLLINTQVLHAMESTEPIFEEQGIKFWESIDVRRTYLIGMDVAEGLGQDYGTLEIYDDRLKQVGEFRSNNLSEANLYDKFKILVKYILRYKHQGKSPSIMWSFENNACGKVISTLYYADTNFPEEAELISVGAKLGMNTNYASKTDASKDLKRLIEQANGMKIRSKDLIVELKNYAQKGTGGTYEAKPGATDDLISATLIVTRLYKYVSTYDDNAFHTLYRGASDEPEESMDDGSLEPMPFGLL